MMRTRHGMALVGVLMVGCADDGVATPPGDDSSSGDLSTGPGTTGNLPDPTTTTAVDSGSTATGPGETTATDTTTGDSGSSTGPTTECGNDVVEAGEICDGVDLAGEDCTSLGFDSGTLACADDCSAFDLRGCSSIRCGNNVQEAEEVCDGTDAGAATCRSEGFDSGTLGCAPDCMSLDPSTCGTCGNVIVDGDEVCDSIVLLGQTCMTQGFDSGALACADDCLTYVTDDCGTCGNAIIDGDETCDGLDNDGQTCLSLGYDSGTLGPCDPSCMAFDPAGCGTCGNAVIDGDETCDGAALAGQTCQTQGFDNGALACAADCSAFDPSGCGTCGNAVVDGSESCDGANLGGQTCASLGLVGGVLSCNAGCQYDFSACDIAGLPFGSDVGYTGHVFAPPVLPCDDISATGTPLGLTDDQALQVPIGFSFPVYDVAYTDVTINSNGTMRWEDSGYLTYVNTCLPSNANPSTRNLYVFWDDLDPTAGAGEVYVQTLGAPGSQRLVVQWDTANFSGDTNDLMRFQVMLHETTGQIEVCYADTLNGANVGNSGAEATSGIQLDSANALQFSCNTPDLTDGTLLLYVPI